MTEKKAQIAVEYLILTGFILITVALVFSFTFVNYNQNIRAAKTSEAISKLANAVDDVYTRGEGNTRFVKITWPDGLKDLRIVHKFNDGCQGTLTYCGEADYDNVEFSAIVFEMELVNEDVIIMEGTRAKIFEGLNEGIADMAEIRGRYNRYSGSIYIVKVSWYDKLIKLEMA